jgi:hypothetical protein
MRSLQDVLEYDYIREFPVFASSDECDEMIGVARKYIAEGVPLREKIRSVSKRRCDEAMRLPTVILDKIVTEVSKEKAGGLEKAKRVC